MTPRLSTGLLLLMLTSCAGPQPAANAPDQTADGAAADVEMASTTTGAPKPQQAPTPPQTPVFSSPQGPVEPGAVHDFQRLWNDVYDAATQAAQQQLVDAFMQAHQLLPYTSGTDAVFVYQDAQGELGADATISVASDFSDWQSAPMWQLGNTNLYFRWYVNVPPDARVDYKLVRKEGGAEYWMLDGRNGNQSPGLGGPNSELRMPNYVPSPWLQYRDVIAHGWVGDLSSDVPTSNWHRLYVYFPPGHYEGAGPYPALVVNDGGDYKDKALFANVLDALIAEGHIEPLVVMFVVPNDRDQEYFGDCPGSCAGAIASYIDYLTDDLLPFARANWKVAGAPSQVGILGASYGGYLALRAAHLRPDVFGFVAAQSARVDAPYNGEFAALGADYVSHKRLDLNIYLDSGRINDLYDDDAAFYEKLLQAGYTKIYFAAYNEGHAWGNWRARLDELLIQGFVRM